MFKKILDYFYYQYEIIAQKILFLAKIYIKIHHPSVLKEIKMCDISSSDKVIQIGCGAIPYTLIIFYNELKVSLTGIDIKEKAVTQAKEFLKKFNLPQEIKIKKGDGSNYDFSKYDLILISYGAKNTEQVLKNVLSNSKQNTKILLRKTTAENTDMLEYILDKYKTKRKKMLLTQESILIYKKTEK